MTPKSNNGNVLDKISVMNPHDVDMKLDLDN